MIFEVGGISLRDHSIVQVWVSFEDQQGGAVAVGAVDLYVLDLDRNEKLNVREEVCYDLDELDLTGSAIPGFDSNSVQLKSEPVQPGYIGTQLKTTYHEDHKCNGDLATTLGSVTVESNQVGYKCDFTANLALADFKPVKCTDPGCFTDTQCVPEKKLQYFGLVDKDTRTCTVGSTGCEFETGINPLLRVVKTRYLGRSSLHFNLCS